MEFLRPDGDYQELGEAWARYRDYLESVKGVIPREAYDFAVASWHYDPADHRSLHDAWVEEISVREETSSEGDTRRKLGIIVRLIGPYHDGQTQLSYVNVSAYQLVSWNQSTRPEPTTLAHAGHGDWLIDELRLSASGNLVHEVIFSSGARWLIECESIRHSTNIPAIQRE